MRITNTLLRSLEKLKMVNHHHIQGYDNFCAFINDFKSPGKLIHVFFSGSKQENGESWCTYCVRAAPVIEKTLTSAPDDSHFVYVEIERPFWKDPNSPFRKDHRLNLKVLPTLVRWGSPLKLEGEQCAKEDLLEMLFTEDE